MASMKQLAAEKREGVGKGAARAVRRSHRVPAVIYGGGQAPLPISLDYANIHKLIYAGHFLTTQFEIKVGNDTIRAIPRDYQLESLNDTPLHVDFLRLSAGSTLRVEIPVHFINQDISPGLKKGGALNIVRHSVEMIVLADSIPESITIDLAAADINDTLKISAVTMPEGAKTVIQGRDFTIATIIPPKQAPEEPAAAAAAPSAAAAKK
jgi:large subunit ribosomal protein L25